MSVYFRRKQRSTQNNEKPHNTNFPLQLLPFSTSSWWKTEKVCKTSPSHGTLARSVSSLSPPPPPPTPRPNLRRYHQPPQYLLSYHKFELNRDVKQNACCPPPPRLLLFRCFSTRSPPILSCCDQNLEEINVLRITLDTQIEDLEQHFETAHINYLQVYEKTPWKNNGYYHTVLI